MIDWSEPQPEEKRIAIERIRLLTEVAAEARMLAEAANSLAKTAAENLKKATEKL